MIATTIEQSKSLLELGLPKETADMSWYNSLFEEKWFLVPRTPNEVETTLLDNEFDDVEIIPAWSLSALLELMPKELEIALVKTPVSGEYFFSWWTDDNHMGDDYKDPVTTAYEMVVWLLENGYIERGGV